MTNGYYPRARCKNKDILKDFTDLNENRIRRDELDEIVGNNDIFKHVGFDFSIPEIYVFMIDHDWECKIPKDCEEISNIEYRELEAKNKKSEIIEADE